MNSRQLQLKNPSRILCLYGNSQAASTIYMEMQRTQEQANILGGEKKSKLGKLHHISRHSIQEKAKLQDTTLHPPEKLKLC